MAAADGEVGRAADLGAAVDTLLAQGRAVAAFELVSDAFARRADAGDLPEMAAVVSAFPDPVLGDHPRVLLELARACDAQARVRLRTRLLERLERVVAATPDGGLQLAVAAERVADLARDTRFEEVEAAAADLLGAIDTRLVDNDDELAREALARTLFAWGRVLAWRGDPASAAAAEDVLLRAAGTARALGRSEWRAQALQVLGYAVHFERGEEKRATDRLREAIALLPAGHPRRAGTLSFLAEAYVRSHRPSDAAPILAELREEAAATGDQRSLGYAAWILALLGAEQGEAAATLEWLIEAERHPGDWFDHSTGIEFLADATVCAERVGATAEADAYLARAQDRATAEGWEEVVWFARGMVAARRGDPAAAIRDLTYRLEADYLPPREVWSTWLYLALARLRSGDAAGAAADAARGFEAAGILVGPGRAAASSAELPAVVARLEPDLSGRLAPLAAAAGSAVAARLQPAAPRIRLFGGLSVRVGGQPVTIPEGRPALLVMIVAMANGPLPLDAAAEALWPNVSGDIGRRRLRNVLARVRVAGAHLLVRSGESLSVAAGTAIDVVEFDEAYARVHRALPSERLSLARAALTLYRGELLPEAAYAPQVATRRDRLAVQAYELLSLLAADAEQAGQVDETVALLDRMYTVDPYDDRAVRRAVALLRANGRDGAAERWLARLDADL